MSGFRAVDADGRVVEADLTPESLHRLLAEHADLRVESPGWGADHGATARRRTATETWRVEIRSSTGRVVTDAPSTAATYDILRSWAAADGWWQEAFSWTSVD